MTRKGERIRDAVLEYVAEHPDAMDEADLASIRNGEAFHDHDDSVKIGSWLLDDRDGDPVLTRQQGGGQPDRLTVIHLEQTDGEWRVTDVGEERFHF